MRKRDRFFALALSLTLLLTFAPFARAADGADAFTITNPYENVDWAAVGAYKTALHTHTNASDGNHTLKASLERHYEAGFDIVAVTDHGTVDRGWETAVPDRLIHGVLKLANRTEGELVAPGAAGTFDDGVAYTYSTAENGDDYLRTEDGRTIMRVPYGIEQNAVSVNAHVNSWFADFHDNTVSDYADAVRGVDAAGGVCVINHPGEYTKARYELHSADAYDPENPVYRYYINKFAALLDRYDACIGIDVNSKGDNRTRFDRILWDELLTRFSADGRNVFAIASSDAHSPGVIDTGYVTALLPELTSAALRGALTRGEFFPQSHCIGNYEELAAIAAALKAFYGKTALYEKVNAAAEEIAARVAAIEAGELAADEDIGAVYTVLDGDGRCTAETHPAVRSIAVDDAENVISIETENALLVRFISDGRQIAALRADEAAIDLDDYADELGNYVRAEVFGEGGVLYTQAFLLNAEAHAGASPVTDRGFVNLGAADFLFADLFRWYRVTLRFFRGLF